MSLIIQKDIHSRYLDPASPKIPIPCLKSPDIKRIMFTTLLKTLLSFFGFILFWHTLVRLIRHFYKFPMPEFLANLIDNPLRRKIQPPDQMPIRHGVTSGMTVLEVGPGNGRYTTALARHVGIRGQVITIDIEPKMIRRLTQRAQAEGITNLQALVADVYHLPFQAAAFDAVCMITVIGEIPEPMSAMRDFHRILKPSGTLAFSELLMDPDYPLVSTLIRQAAQVGFRPKQKSGSFFSYTLVFDKSSIH